MKKIFLIFGVLVALVVMGGASASAATPPSKIAPAAGKAQPGWTYANAFWRTREWAEADTGDGAYEPYECRGPYENAHGKTQWACFGNFPPQPYPQHWQVNIDAYGAQTYSHFS